MKVLKKGLRQEEYDYMVEDYFQAMQMISFNLEGMNEEFRKKRINYPIHSIQKRIKSKKSIEKKLEKKNLDITVDNARNELTDIAGIRVICYFTEDIYEVVGIIKKYWDCIVIKESDYIAEPKENGYKSYHIVLGVRICSTDFAAYYPVEIQLRTLEMDLWASMEHRLCYKNSEISPEKRDYFVSLSEKLENIEKDLKLLDELIPSSKARGTSAAPLRSNFS